MMEAPGSKPAVGDPGRALRRPHDGRKLPALDPNAVLSSIDHWLGLLELRLELQACGKAVKRAIASAEGVILAGELAARQRVL